MHLLFQNRYVRFSGFTIGALLLGLVFLTLISSLNSSRSNGFSSHSVGMYAPSMADEFIVSEQGMAEYDLSDDAIITNSYRAAPSIQPGGGYVAELESYETSTYSVSLSTNELDSFCTTLTKLKSDQNIDFKSINSGTNYCRAVFYTNEENAQSVITTLEAFSGISIDRNTSSVTRHKNNLQSRSDILRQQLESVQKSLTTVETEFDEIITFAREQNDAVTLSETIREKLQLVDTLTQRKISLTSQLDNLLQQSSELEERIDVVEFSVSANRLTPIIANQTERKWLEAHKELNNVFTDTLIGLSVFFGVFLLWVIRLTIYLLVLLLVVRGVWKFTQFIWKRW